MEVVLDARLMGERTKAHTYLKEQLELPEYYGNNLDALYDCLTELSDTLIIIEYKDEADSYFDKVYHVMLEAEKSNEELTIVLLDDDQL